MLSSLLSLVILTQCTAATCRPPCNVEASADVVAPRTDESVRERPLRVWQNRTLHSFRARLREGCAARRERRVLQNRSGAQCRP